MRVRSFFPPLSYKGDSSGRWYIICSSDGDGWIEVDRKYEWAELAAMWDKIEYTKSVKVKSDVKKEWKVNGSKKNSVYSVVNDAGYWSCSCPAFGFGRGKACKHIKQIQEETSKKRKRAKV